MSGGMGYYSGDLYDENDPDAGQFDNSGQAPQQGRQQPNPLRDHLKKVEDQNSELQKQVAQLLQTQRQSKVADELQAKGYDRAAATLYQGEPDKLDEWLTSVGPLLAKQPTPTGGQGQGQPGQAPTSTVPADGQAAMQQIQQAGMGATAPQGSDAEQVAQLRNAESPEAMMQYLQSQGNPYHWNS